MYFLHHYLQKGYRPEEMISLSSSARMFFKASMRLELEQKDKQKRNEVEFMAKLHGMELKK